jgi:hypothetical protein
VVEIVYNSMVRTRIHALPPLLRVAVEDNLHYFEDFGRAAQLLDVAKVVQLEETWEARNQMTIDGRRYTIRILLRLHLDTLAYATVFGDKDRWNPARGDWYDAYGNISDMVYNEMKGNQ